MHCCVTKYNFEIAKNIILLKYSELMSSFIPLSSETTIRRTKLVQRKLLPFAFSESKICSKMTTADTQLINILEGRQ